MVRFELEFTATASGNLSRLDPPAAQQVMDRLKWLAENCASLSHVALTGPWAGRFRLRAGDYRALYTIDRENRRIVVELVGHRSDVY